jgi:uncharacterized membrane protein
MATSDKAGPRKPIAARTAVVVAALGAGLVAVPSAGAAAPATAAASTGDAKVMVKESVCHIAQPRQVLMELVRAADQ